MRLSKEVKIGIYFAVTLGALVWGINFLKGKDIFNKVQKLYAIYDDIEGLQTTAQVSIKGLKVGTVSKIRLDQETEKFKVELQIKSNYSVPNNSVAYLYSSDIMGNKAIKIKIGDSHEMLTENSIIKTGMEEDAFSLLMDDLPSIKNNLNKTIKDVDSTFQSINRLFSDENIENLSKGIAHLSNTMQNVSQLSAALNKNKANIVSSLENVDSITSNLRNNSANINRIINNLTELSDSLKVIRFAEVVDELKTVINKINSGTGNAGKLIYDESMYNNIVNSLDSLNDLLSDIKENPKRYINISVFGKKSK
ncbi:MAG: MlaD family protein [Prevotellaceae bacterium]|jgi:phospholipid/cholesterol/gamma-HCH transport system substrate-binding protein|nr:MlaD family protein [Prevotellaceae bacterium]